MIKINLLPAKAKQELSLKNLKRCIVVIGVFFISLCLLFAIFLIIIYLVLHSAQTETQHSNSLFSQAQELEEQVHSLNQELSGLINKQLERVDQIQQEQQKSSWVLQKLSQISPANTRLSLLEIEKQKVKIAGFAKTRKSALLFQQILEQEPQFINLDSPLSNFVKQKNINFFFSFDIKK